MAKSSSGGHRRNDKSIRKPPAATDKDTASETLPAQPRRHPLGLLLAVLVLVAWLLFLIVMAVRG
jgi:hypothetical protein